MNGSPKIDGIIEWIPLTIQMQYMDKWWGPLKAKPQEVADMDSTFVPPVADPGQHVNPAQAAKQLRKLMRLALDYMDAGFSGQSNPKWSYTRSYMRNARDAYLPNIEAHLVVVEEALKKRQTAPGLEAVRVLRSNLQVTKEAVGTVFVYADQEKNGDHGAISFNETTSKQLKKTMESMHSLIQSLPTIAGSPSNLPENVLRTIGVVLENAGYVAKKVPDVLPEPEEEELDEPEFEPEEEEDHDG